MASLLGLDKLAGKSAVFQRSARPAPALPQQQRLSSNFIAQRPRDVRMAAVAGIDRALKRYQYDQLTEQDMKTVLARPRIDFTSILSTVRLSRRRLE